MTTTVTVKARAHGANVTIRNKGAAHDPVEEVALEGNTERKFHLDEGQVLEVGQGAAPVIEEELAPHTRTGLNPNNVPGRAENDRLIKTGPGTGVAKTDVEQTQA